MNEISIICKGIVDIERNPFSKKSWREESNKGNSKGSGKQMQPTAIVNFQKILDNGGKIVDINEPHYEKYATFQAIRWGYAKIINARIVSTEKWAEINNDRFNGTLKKINTVSKSNFELIKSLPSIENIEKHKTSPWDFGNRVLYDLCKENFNHQDASKILSKVWLIGRAYSAALERRKKKKSINDNFYIDEVLPAFVKSKIDVYLNDLRQYNELTIEILPKILKVHSYLTQLTKSITLLEKRSFSSKYLHFHLPNLFFIYDSRVVGSLRQFIDRVPIAMEMILHSDDIDREYAKFVCKSFVIIEDIKKQYNIELTPRQFDNILIDIANDKMNSFKNI